MSIFIFSRPIHSGKTTALLQWCRRQENVSGVLMPDINGTRKILDLSKDVVFDIECTDKETTDEPVISIGRFHFYTKAFNRANSILLDALILKPDWLVIDEAGKLELDGKGFYEAIEKAASFYNNPNNTGNLLITVRDSLCEEMTRFFKLVNFRIIHDLAELDNIK